MAMLAEPRRRQKIGPNPRGKFFLEDDDNKGRTLLQKLGWQTGNGLGRQNQGMSAPLCPKIQMDSKGLGYDVKNDPWVVHNEEFSNLLGTLEAVVPEGNKSDQAAKKKFNTKGQANSSSEEDSGSGGRKLEKKSKSSRFRIHYHKFIKNKDVSNFSNTDLSCIFGQPTDSLINKTKKSKAGSSKETLVPTIEDPFDEDGVKTINAGSMNDYFNAKMKERDLKAKEQAKEIKPETVEDEEDGLKTVNRGSMIDYFKSMMAKRRLKAEADTGSNSAETDYKKLSEDENEEEEAEEEPDNNNDATSILIPEEFDAGIEKNKIRELKRKVHEVLEIDGNDNETDPNHSEDDRTVIIKSKKSKKDKKKKTKSKSKEIDEDGARSIVENEQEAEVDEPTPTVEELLAEKKAQNFAKKEKRKKSKKRKLVTEVEEETLCDGDDDNVALLNTQDDEPKSKKLKKSKKSKKSKKLVVEECEEMMNSSVDESLELEAEVPVKKAKLDFYKKKNKNKSKKNKHQILEEQQEQSDDVNEDGDGGSGSGTGDEIPDEDGAEPANDSTLNDSSSFRKRRPNKKRMSGEELKKLSMTFKGANLHRIRGYAYY